MDPQDTDRLIRDLYKQSLPPVDMDEFSAGVRGKLWAMCQEGDMPEAYRLAPLDTSSDSAVDWTPMAHRPRKRRTGPRVAVAASVAVVLLVAVAVGSWQMVKRGQHDLPVVLITDGTAGMSPGSTIETTPPPASESPPLRWRFKTGEPPVDVPSAMYPARGAPVIANGVVYVAASDALEGLYAVDIATGREKWKFETSEEVSPPAVYEGTVYFASSDSTDSTGYVHAVYSATGREAWRLEIDGASSVAVSEGVLYVGGADFLYALDLSSREEVWRSENGGVSSSLQIYDGSIYFTDGDYLYAVDLETGRVVWKFDLRPTAGWTGSPALSPEAVYVTTGQGSLYAVDRKSGERRWKFELGAASSPPSVSNEPAWQGDTVYAGQDTGYLYAVDASTGRERWRFKADPADTGLPSGGLVVEYGVLYAGLGPSLYEVGLQAGERKWRFATTRLDRSGPWAYCNMLSSPVLLEHVLYFTSSDGYLYALWQLQGGLAP